jgi:hypothetical protein
MVTTAMLTYPNKLLSKAEWSRYCTHLRNLNINNFKMVEAMELKITASMSASVALPSFKISSKSTNQLKN